MDAAVTPFEPTGMEESGSEGLDDLVRKEAKQGGFLTGIDAVCISGACQTPLAS